VANLKTYHPRLHDCSCGSGEEHWAEFDARGIFLTYVCEQCRDQKLKKYRKDVLDDPNYWHDEPIDEDY
jgi:hypothetical protein